MNKPAWNTCVPFASTSWAPMMLSQVSPCCLMAKPMPPPSARPCSRSCQLKLKQLKLSLAAGLGLATLPVQMFASGISTGFEHPSLHRAPVMLTWMS